MEIKTTTVYDKKALRAFANVQMCGRKNPKRYKAVRIIPAIILLLLAVLTTALITKDGGDWKTLLFPMVIIVGYIAINLLTPVLLYKNFSKLEGNVNQYTFTDEEFIVESSAKGMSGETRISYDNLLKIFETYDYLFVYINTMAVFVLDKSSTSENDLRQIKDKLRSAVGEKKYIVCKY